MPITATAMARNISQWAISTISIVAMSAKASEPLQPPSQAAILSASACMPNHRPTLAAANSTNVRIADLTKTARIGRSKSWPSDRKKA